MSDGVQEFGLPDLGEGLEEATVTRWVVAEGDEVALNDPLCTVETAKAEVEIPSPYAGVVVERRGASGEELAVGSLLVRIDTSGASAEGEPTGGERDEAPRRQAVLVGYGVEDESGASNRPRAPVPARPRAKPPVRKLARDLGVDLTDLAPGSGRDGVITRDDVTRAAAAPAQLAISEAADSGAVTEPLSGIRARIAEKMTAARQHIPDAHASVTADFTRLLDVRARLQEAADTGAAETLTPFAVLLRLLVSALRAHPVLNSTFAADPPSVRTFDAVHLGVGVATEHGLEVGLESPACGEWCMRPGRVSTVTGPSCVGFCQTLMPGWLLWSIGTGWRAWGSRTWRWHWPRGALGSCWSMPVRPLMIWCAT
jgi:pyruvate dehydrogenase E2 component (dihydrolipoamide acetyltransferase)